MSHMEDVTEARQAEQQRVALRNRRSYAPGSDGERHRTILNQSLIWWPATATSARQALVQTPPNIPSSRTC